MSKKIDARIPRDVGKGVIPERPVIATPWDKMIW